MDTQQGDADQVPGEEGTYRLVCFGSTATLKKVWVPNQQPAVANPQGGATAAADTQGPEDVAQGAPGGSAPADGDTSTAAQQAGRSGLIPDGPSNAAGASNLQGVQAAQPQRAHAGMGVFRKPDAQPQQPAVQPQQQFNSWAQPGQAPPTDHSLGTLGQLWSRLPSDAAGFGSVTQQNAYPPISPAQPRMQQQQQPQVQQESPFTPGHGWAGFQSAPQASRGAFASEPGLPFAQRLQQVASSLVTGPQLPGSPANNVNTGKDADS